MATHDPTPRHVDRRGHAEPVRDDAGQKRAQCVPEIPPQPVDSKARRASGRMRDIPDDGA
jgi:hypothetical protein